MGLYLAGVVGESFDNRDGSSRQDIIAGLTPGQPLFLVPNPANPHDSMAVEVHCQAGQIGHVGRKDEWLQQRAHRNVPLKACVAQLNIGPDATGVVMLVATGGEDLAEALADRGVTIDEDAALRLLIDELGMSSEVFPRTAEPSREARRSWWSKLLGR